MNLHIAPDNVFTNKFIENLNELGLEANNHVVVRTNAPTLRHVKANAPFGAVYSRQFRNHVGKTERYDRVYIHQFTPLLYRWVALNHFKELNWAIWGADLYNLPFNRRFLYEPLTLSQYVNKIFSYKDFLYQVKVALMHNSYREAAYAKVKNVLTWMTAEYEFARKSLPFLKADHKFFFYENQLPYEQLDTTMREDVLSREPMTPVFILGNSSTPDLNHLDIVRWMQDHAVRADLRIPVSYGDARYTRFLKKSLSFYTGGDIEFVDRYMSIGEYLQFLNSADGLIMNNIRPQGYGNIFLMMYLGKPVFLNRKNISTSDLDKRDLVWEPIDKLEGMKFQREPRNRPALIALLSHEKLLNTYRELFS